MFGIPSQQEIQEKAAELQSIVTEHQETWHFAGVTAVVQPLRIVSLHFEDGAVITNDLVRDTINTAFENHKIGSQKMVQAHIMTMKSPYKEIFQRMMPQ